jgi:hypothetical protein
MTDEIRELEQEIERSRARLDLTIDRLESKLSLSGVLDDVLGIAKTNNYGKTYDTALAVLKRNPLAVMLVAAGVGLLIHRMSRDPGQKREVRRPNGPGDARLRQAAQMADPDTPLPPLPEGMESRRPLNARV